MISCSSLLALILTGFELRASYYQGVSEIERMHQELTLVHGDVLIQQIWALDERAAQVSIEGLVKLNAIDKVDLSWEGHTLMTEGELEHRADIETVFPLHTLRAGEPFLLGELTLYSSLYQLRSEMVSLLGVRLLFNFLKTLIVACVLLYFFHRIATVHLRKISQHADSLALGESYKPLSLERGERQTQDELQVLVDAINGMGYRLQQDFIRREHQQIDLERLVGERTNHLEDLNQQLVEKSRLATIGSLVAMVAHELRNPLGSIKATVMLLKARYVNTDDAPSIARIERNIDRCDETVEQLRRMSNKSNQHWQVVNLAQWMFDYVENKLQIDQSIELRSDLASDLPVFVDQFQLDMVVRNLLENAEHALQNLPHEQQRVIYLKACREGVHAVLEITDTGCGIEKSDLEKVFDPLFSTKQYGFGMGLTLSRNLVEFLGGQLHISSQGEMKGTVAQLRLPLDTSGREEVLRNASTGKQ